MAANLDEIWRRCSELEERLHWRRPFLPGVYEFTSPRRVTAADYSRSPEKQIVARVLQELLDAAEHAFDFEAQRAVLDLMQDLEEVE